MRFLVLLLSLLVISPSWGQSFFDLLNEFADEKVPPETPSGVSLDTTPDVAPLKAAKPQNTPDLPPPSLNEAMDEDAADEFAPDEFAPEEKIQTNGVTLQGLDTETGRVFIIDAPLNQTIEFGTLHLKVHKCYKNAPGERAESIAFLTIGEKKKDEALNPLFSGWMFSTSPALSALDHPVYDVWVKECTIMGEK